MALDLESVDGRGVVWKSQIEHPLLDAIYSIQDDGCKAGKQRSNTLAIERALGASGVLGDIESGRELGIGYRCDSYSKCL